MPAANVPKQIKDHGIASIILSLIIIGITCPC